MRLVHATEQANVDVYHAGRRPSLLSMGATVTAVLVEGGTAYVAEVGDSRAYLVRGGEIHALTVDQSYAQIAIESGVMTEDELQQSPLRNLLAQAMGQELDIRVAVSELALRERDCLVLCTDGLTKHVKDEEIRDRILQSPTLAAAAESLIALAIERGGDDNVTALLVGVSGDVAPLSPAEPFDDTFRVVRPFR